MSPIIIGITGFKRSGKDTAAVYLLNCFSYKKFPIVKRLGFADGVKEEIAEALGTTVKVIEDRKNIPEVRRLLQWWGTEFRRADNDLYWIDRLANKIAALQWKAGPDKRAVIIIADCRFPNEADFIRSNGGYIIKVERPGFDNSNDPHPSEAFVSSMPAHIYIKNDNKPLKLQKEIEWLFMEHITRHFKL